MTAQRVATSRPRRRASRSTRRANTEGAASVSWVAALSMAAEQLTDPEVTDGDALRVAALRGPHRDQLDLARPRGAVGPLPRAPDELRGAHGHAGAVHAQVHHRCRRGALLDDVPLVLRDLATERLRGPLDLLGIDADAGQLVNQLAALREADHGRGVPHHARDRR